MPDDRYIHCCETCGRYVTWPDRAHDGCGGHSLCPFCGADLQLTYERPSPPAGPHCYYRRIPAHA